MNKHIRDHPASHCRNDQAGDGIPTGVNAAYTGRLPCLRQLVFRSHTKTRAKRRVCLTLSAIQFIVVTRHFTRHSLLVTMHTLTPITDADFTRLRAYLSPAQIEALPALNVSAHLTRTARRRNHISATSAGRRRIRQSVARSTTLRRRISQRRPLVRRHQRLHGDVRTLERARP